MLKSIILILTTCCSLSLFSQDSLLVEHLKKNVHTFLFEDGNLSGDGLSFFKEEADQNSFFLIGEDHGIGDIPLFTAALFEQFNSHGYEYFATETGPYTADMVQEMAAKDEWETLFKQHFEQYPWSIPFYIYQEECTILRNVLKNNPQGKQLIWGLDQEFAASFRMFFKKLEMEAEKTTAKTVANEYYEMAESTFKEAAESKNPGKSLLAVIQPSDFEKLRNAFSDQPASVELINELEKSVNIYRMWFTRQGYESNCTRAEMMKRYFMKYYSAAKAKGESPKVMFKFGANHIYRGLNGLNVFDIGNFISELASQEGTSSFHMYVIGRKGTQNRSNPFSKSDDDKFAEYDPASYLDKIDFSTVLQATPTTDWAVIDVRPLRKLLFSKQLKTLPKGIEKLIWSYDAILVIPEVHASTFFD